MFTGSITYCSDTISTDRVGWHQTSQGDTGLARTGYHKQQLSLQQPRGGGGGEAEYCWWLQQQVFGNTEGSEEESAKVAHL